MKGGPGRGAREAQEGGRGAGPGGCQALKKGGEGARGGARMGQGRRAGQEGPERPGGPGRARGLSGAQGARRGRGAQNGLEPPRSLISCSLEACRGPLGAPF